MSFVLADQKGWLQPSKQPFEFKVLQNFKNLRDGVNDSSADFFMWEHFTSKKYYDSGEIKRVGEIYTPWKSWMIVASTAILDSPAANERVAQFMRKLNQGVEYFNGNPEEAVEYIEANLDYSKEDARSWLSTVKFSEDVTEIDEETIGKTIEILKKANVIQRDVTPQEMILEGSPLQRLTSR